jgi:hypothetical protein
MRIMLLAALAAVLLLAGDARAGSTVTFDFDTLSPFRGDAFISGYMSNVYGSPVMTEGARTVADDFIDSDIFIATSIQFLGRGDFEITFGEVPIVGASFEGHVIDATVGDDFRFTAYFDAAEVFSFTRNDGAEVFEAGFFSFPGPANRLVISDTARKDVGIDNLTVQPVPEPRTGVIGLVAVAVMWGCGRRW